MVKKRRKKNLKKIDKKSQEGSQFFFNYGWTFLILGAVLAALIYLGVLSPDKFIPEQCKFMEGLSCVDVGKDNQGIWMTVYNNMGFEAKDINLTLRGPGCMDGQGVGPNHLGIDKMGEYHIKCPLPSGRFKGQANFRYTHPRSNLKHDVIGQITVI